MDPISAFGLAVNVLTIVDLGIKVAASYRSGGALDAPKLQEYSTGLENLSSKLISNNQYLQSAATQSTEKSLQECAEKAVTASRALQEELAKSQTGASRFRKFTKSIKNTFSRRIEDLERELRNIQADLDTRLLVSLRENIDFGVIEQSKQYKSLDYSIQTLFKEFCLSHTKDVDLIRSDNESTRAVIINELRSWKTEADRKDIEDRKNKLLESLVHSSPFTRENDIHEEHRGTFEWVLKDTTLSNKSIAFSTWLREGNGIFWVQGKPGSGKSSFMKFVRKSDGVSKLLNSWAAPRKPQMIKFFFWLADTTRMQNSLKGFLCSLLYQTLKTNWTLDETYLTDHQLCEKKTALNWDIAELKKILLIAIEEAAKITPLFFLIDGLDECKEDDFDGVIEIILAIASNPNMKLCVSSRPETKIRNTFRDIQFLEVQEHTEKDIWRYVRDTLGKIRDTHLTEEAWDMIIGIIARCSAGVFLWSIVVAKDVAKGVMNGDPVDQLIRRVQQLPKDMSKLYEEMLKRVGPDWELYKCEAASYFNLRLDWEGNWPYWPDPSTWQADYGYRGFQYSYLGEFVFLYERFHGLRLAKKTPVAPEEISHISKVKSRIETVCGGILVVHPPPTSARSLENLPVDLRALLKVWTYRVDFIHRTAKDYLRDMGSEILSNCPITPVDRYIGICNANMELWERGIQPRFSLSGVAELLNQLRWIDGDGELILNFLDDFENRVRAMVRNSISVLGVDWVYYLAKSLWYDRLILDFSGLVLLANRGSRDVLSLRIDRLSISQNGVRRTLSTRYKSYILWRAIEERDMLWIERLLSEGVDLNTQLYFDINNRVKTTHWLNLLSSNGLSWNRTERLDGFILNLIKRFLLIGANLNEKTVVFAACGGFNAYDVVPNLPTCFKRVRSWNPIKILEVLEVNALFLLKLMFRIARKDFGMLAVPEDQMPEPYCRILLVYTSLDDPSDTESNKAQPKDLTVMEIDSYNSERLLDGRFDNLESHEHGKKIDDRNRDIMADLRKTAKHVSLLEYLEKLGYYKTEFDPAVPQGPIPMFDDEEPAPDST